MTPISEFTKFILPFVHDCSGLAAEIAARFAVIQFCEQTDWLQYEVDPITIQAGVADYEIEAPQDSIPLRIVSANILDRIQPLEEATQDELVRYYGDWRAVEGDPWFYTQIDRNNVRLVPSPLERVTQGLRLLISVRPTQDAPEIDDTIYERFGEAIGYGARARLMEMAGQPYYDPVNAPKCWKMFNATIVAAKIERTKDFTRSNLRVRLRKF